MSLSEYDSGASHFRTTAWSVILGAQNAIGGRDDREQCLAFLCRHYWKPIYYYIRRRGLSHDDAIDVTQDYFATFLEKDFVAAVDRDRGKFRTFVLVTVNRFLSKHLARRAKRDPVVSINLTVGEDGEEELSLPELATGETAEDDFNRRWAMSLIDRTLEKMRLECRDGRKRQYFEAFQMHIDSASDTKQKSYREMAEAMGFSETDVTNFLHRGRNIFHKLLRDEIRALVSTEKEIDEEIEALKEYLRR